MSPSTRRMMLNKLDQQKDAQANPFEMLSIREVEVMSLLTKGIPLFKIAEMLHLQISTVSTYKTRIFTKLEISSIIELLEKIRFYNISI
jgi:DNA-binding NarL/FixJ family response regulator